MKALVMGGGMSGLATAINLLEMGVEVELVEADTIFGGRVSSWLDEDGDLVDNALHVFFPYYVNLLEFFGKLGISDRLLWKRSEFDFMQEGGNMVKPRFNENLPAPLHMLPALPAMLRDFKGLSLWKNALMGARLGWGLLLSNEAYEKLDDLTLAQWVTRFAPWDCLTIMEPGTNGLTFTPSTQLSAKIMLGWARKVFAAPKSCKLAFANGGMGEIWVDSCLDYIRSKGGKLELGKAVTAINVEDGQVKNVIINGSEERTADVYVSAISPYSLRTVLPDDAYYYEYFRDLQHFRMAPSLSFMVWFDRKLTDCDLTVFSYDCIFNTYADMSNVLPHVYKGGSMFEMVISPADHVEGLPDEVIADIAIQQIKGLFPEARESKVLKWKVVRERQGVYRALPGMESHRPFQRSPYGNFYLTGDFTKTHVSSGGMEAAIWTANKCAELISEDKLGKQVELNVEYSPKTGFMPFLRPAVIAGAAVGALLVARKAAQVYGGYLKYRKGARKAAE
jgi:15-cis-phytoene desaturase